MKHSTNKDNSESINLTSVKKTRYVTINENIVFSLTGSTLKLYLAMRYETDYSVSCSSVNKKIKFFVNKTGLSRSKIFECLNELEKNGLIIRQSIIGGQTRYTVSDQLNHFSHQENKQREFTSPCPEKPDTVKPVQNLDGVVQNLDGVVQNLDTLTSNSFSKSINNNKYIKTYTSSDDEGEKIKEKKQKVVDDSYLTSFERFYSVYPRKKGKQDAIRWFKREKPATELVDLLINDIKKRLVTEWLGKDPQYLPYPATYLNGKRWEDEPETIDTTLLKQLKSPAVLESSKEMPINPNYEYPETYFMQTVTNQLTKAQISTFDEMYDMYPASASYEQCKAEWFKKGCHLIAREVIFPTLKEQIAKDRRFQTSRYIPSLLNYISKMSWMDKIVSDDKSKGRFDHDNMSWALDSRKSILE